MRTAVFSTKPYDREFLQRAAEAAGHELAFFEPRLTPQTAVLAGGFPAICSFVNDPLNAALLGQLIKDAGDPPLKVRVTLFTHISVDDLSVDVFAVGPLE